MKRKEHNLSTSDMDGYLDNLNEEGLRRLAREVLLYGKTEEALKCIKEFSKFYKQ